MDTYYVPVLEKAKTIHKLFDLTGKTAVVIGGTKGLGLAMAIALAGAGAKICVASRSPDDSGTISELISHISDDFLIRKVDATKENEVSQLFKEVSETFGSIDILINSQGTVQLGPTVNFSVEKWQSVIDSNLKSVFICCKHAAPYMLEKQWGRIINISSVRGFQGRKEDPAYAPSKGAVNQLTRSLAIEWGPKGINVNGLAPVFTKTIMSEEFLKDEEKKRWVLSRIPMNRLGELQDVMGPAVFLASEASGFVNGQVLPVDGGWLAG